MKFEYKGYNFQIKEVINQEGRILQYKAVCDEAKSLILYGEYLDRLIGSIQVEIDLFLKQREDLVPVFETSEWYYRGFILVVRFIGMVQSTGNRTFVGECKDLGFLTDHYFESEFIRTSFKKEVDNWYKVNKIRSKLEVIGFGLLPLSDYMFFSKITYT